MSCRVLGRQVEQAILNHVVRQALQAGKARLLGHYIPTSKNKLVELHYQKLGFALLGHDENNGTIWALDLERIEPFDAPIRTCCANEARQAC
jgi:predicted enzyme involved in methoxymalonyl-ACP biosynthesis